MSPVAKFEESARTIWRSDLSADEKGKRLTAVRAALVHYIARLDAKKAEADADPWTARSFARVRRYLVLFAADVEDLSLKCETMKPKKKPNVVPTVYAA